MSRTVSVVYSSLGSFRLAGTNPVVDGGALLVAPSSFGGGVENEPRDDKLSPPPFVLGGRMRGIAQCLVCCVRSYPYCALPSCPFPHRSFRGRCERITIDRSCRPKPWPGTSPLSHSRWRSAFLFAFATVTQYSPPSAHSLFAVFVDETSASFFRPRPTHSSR